MIDLVFPADPWDFVSSSFSLLLFLFIHISILVAFSYSCAHQSTCRRSFISTLFRLEISLIKLFTLITSSHLSFRLSQISWFTSDLFQNLMMKYLIIFVWLISNSHKIIQPSDLGLFQFAETETSSLFSNLWSSFLSIQGAETTGICHHAWIHHCSHPCVDFSWDKLETQIMTTLSLTYKVFFIEFCTFYLQY